MNTKPTWPMPITEAQLELPIPFPPRPGIQRRILADQCPSCHSVHVYQADRILCLQANGQHEQL